MQSFIYLSRYAGMREDLVQAGGGNSSVKLSPTKMLIKASGYQLAELSDTSGYCEVNPKIITDFFSSTPSDLSSETEKKLLADSLLSGKRPSIETFLHSITQAYTLHTHPTVVNILTSTEQGWETLKAMFPDAMFVGYSTPGIKLAAKYFEEFKLLGKVPDVIFLNNHGLVVSGESADFVKAKTESVLYTIEKKLGLDMERYHELTKIYDTIREIPEMKDKIVCLSQNSDVIKALEVFGKELWTYQFCPDCIVYCGKKALTLMEKFSSSDFVRHIEKYGIPAVLTYNGSIYIIADSMKKAKDIESVLSFSAQVAMNNKNTTVNLLSDDEQNFLLNWDSEKYRQSMK